MVIVQQSLYTMVVIQLGKTNRNEVAAAAEGEGEEGKQ
jgi:hypothetical protein